MPDNFVQNILNSITNGEVQNSDQLTSLIKDLIQKEGSGSGSLDFNQIAESLLSNMSSGNLDLKSLFNKDGLLGNLFGKKNPADLNVAPGGSTTPAADSGNPFNLNTLFKDNKFSNFLDKTQTKLTGFQDKFKNFGSGFNNQIGTAQGAGVLQFGMNIANDYMNKDLVNSKGFDYMNKGFDFATNAISKVNPMVGLMLKGVQTGINGLNRGLAKTTDDFSMNQEAANQLSGAYQGTYGDMSEAEDLANLMYGATNKKGFNEAQDKIGEAMRTDEILTDIFNENEVSQALAMNTQANGLKHSNLLNGGLNITSIGKHGMKLENFNRAKRFKLKHRINLNNKSVEPIKYSETEPVDKFKEGGVIDFNPIIYSYTDPIETDVEFIPIISEEIIMFKDGGKSDKKSKTRTLEELIAYAKEQNPRFIQRMSEPVKDLDLGNGQRATHLMSWSTDDSGNAIVYSEIQENNNGDLFNYGDAAIDRAIKNKNYLIMTPEEAKLFTESGIDENGNLFGYKKGWPEFFKQNFKQGGQIKESEELVKLEETNQKNIIPEGALHKNKHHIENTEGLTQKGIPVIDNDGEQQAEIELNEIIFTLEVTKKLAKLHKIYKEGTNKEQDEAAIEAGKLLVQEILYNTDDRTGLIAKCQKGGKLNG